VIDLGGRLTFRLRRRAHGRPDPAPPLQRPPFRRRPSRARRVHRRPDPTPL